MARFKPQSDVTVAPVTTPSKNHSFKNLYGCMEGNMIYLNMEANETLKGGMTSLRDIAVIVDISGSMNAYYQNGSVAKMITTIVDALAWADKDGLDLIFFSNGLVYETNVTSAADVQAAVNEAIKQPGAMNTTMPTAAFQKFVEQLKAKRRAGTVLFLTDGMMDDGGKELKEFYQNVLHTQFKTRDNFYCYAVEFGRTAFGALNVLDGLYAPEQGPEDLFDLDNADNLEAISQVLKQVGGMSAVGSETVEMVALVDNGAVIDMVNTDLIEGGMTRVVGPINQIMSFRVKATTPFNLTVEVTGYDPVVAHVIPKGLEVDIQVA